MSKAELTARELYDTMRLDSLDEDVKRHLMILILSRVKDIQEDDIPVQIPMSYEDGMLCSPIGLEEARCELHKYADELKTTYDLR